MTNTLELQHEIKQLKMALLNANFEVKMLTAKLIDREEKCSSLMRDLDMAEPVFDAHSCS